MKRMVLLLLCLFSVGFLYCESILNFKMVFEKPEYISMGFYKDEECLSKAKDIIFDIPSGVDTTVNSTFYVKWDCTTKNNVLKLSMIMSSDSNFNNELDSMLTSPGQSGEPIHLNFNTSVTFLDSTLPGQTIVFDASDVGAGNIPKERRKVVLFDQSSEGKGHRSKGRARVDLEINSSEGFMSEPYTGYVTILLETI